MNGLFFLLGLVVGLIFGTTFGVLVMAAIASASRQPEAGPPPKP